MKKFNFNDYIPEELADNESCRLITTEQYKKWKASEKKLKLAKIGLTNIAFNKIFTPRKHAKYILEQMEEV